MRKVEDFNEFLELWNISHKNKYYGTKIISKEKEEEIIKKKDIEDFKRYNIYMLEDNYHFIVLDTKWSINSKLYYDDELETPEPTFDYFRAYNKYNIKYDELKENYKYYFIVNRYSTDREVAVNMIYEIEDGFINIEQYQLNLERCKKQDIFLRFLTPEEVKDYNKIISKIKDDYENRLKKYYKKYFDNISCIGYWANR